MNKLFCIVAATLFLLTIPTISFAFSTDNQWTYLVVHSDTNTREYTNRWFDLAYNDNWWTPITGDGIKPVYTSGSNAVLLRKTINWNGEDLWFRGWEGYAGTCYINQIKVDSQHIHLSDYLKTGNNLVACSIWGKGVTYWENRQAYFYGQFIPVSENQLAWSNSNDWARWFVNNRPINTGTEAKFYFCYDNPQESYGCFLNSAWPWNKDKGVSGTAFTKSFYLESPEEKNIVIGANVMVSGGQYCWNNGQCWPTAYCNFNGQLIGFYPNTHEKYNYKAAVSGKAGINTITCYVPTIKEPNPVNNWSSTGYNKFDLALAPALEILELTEYSVSSEDPTITILVNGAGNATVYAELFENGKSVSVPIEDTLDLNGQTEVPLTLEVNNTGKYSVKITAVYNEYGISKSKDYNLEITETPIVLPITGNPFVQDSGGGSNSAGTDSSSSAIPLAAGLAGVAAVGVGYAALRNSNNRKYGNSSAGPGERLKTFWNNVAKEEKYYNEVRVPEINKRQAEIESIIKGFQEQARKKKEKEELEKVAEQVAWVNKLAGSGKLSTMEAAKELRVLSGSAGIGYENSQKLRSMSNKFLEIAEENDNRQKPVKELQNIMELYKSGKLSAEDLAAKLYKLSKNPYLSSELKGEILGIREEILKALREQGRGKELSMEPDIESVNQPSILGGITGAVTGFGSWVGNGINWLANNVGEPINKGIDWAKGKLWGYAGKAIGAGAGFVNSSLNLVSTVPFVGSSISNSIRNTILTSLSAINSSLTSIQDSILSKSDWIEKTSDSLSVAGMGMIGAGTASMMTGFGTPFAFPTMIAGAGMLAAGSVMDVSVWGAKESAGKANGWDRLRGLFGALMFVPEIGAAGKVGSVGKLVKGGRMLDELSNLKYITKVIQDGKAFYRPHYLNFIDSVSETAGNAVRVTDNLIRKLFNDQLLKNPFLRKDIEILIEESGGKKVLAETFVKTGGWYLGNKIEKIIFYRKAMEKFIKEMKVDSIESIRTIIDHELGHAASVESSKFWEFFGFPVSVRDWILNNIVADHPGVLEEILMGIRAADNDMSRIDIVHKIEDSLGGKYMENFDFVKQAIRELEGKAASSGGQFKEDLLYSARKLEGLMEKYKLEGKILPILGALGLGSLFGGKKDGKSENNVGGFEDSSLKLRKDSPEAARRDDEYNWKNILAAIGGVLGAILLGATTITCNGASLLCPVLEPPITVTGTVFDSLHNPLYSTSVLLHGSGDINKTLTQQSGNFDVIGYHNGTITAKAELKYFPNGLNSAGPAIEMLKINSHNADWSETQTETVSNEQHVMNQTYTIDFTFSHDQGGNAYYGLQNSYDYWRNHETANRISAFVNDPRPATAYYCLDKDKTLPYKCTASNEIHFSTAYQTYVLGLHEYGHSISHNWGLPGGHEEQPNPIEESWADFVIALVQNNSYIGEPYNLDIKNARNASAWGREWALAGVMWDLEQEKQGVVYDTLKPKDDKEKTTTLEILYNKFNSKGGIPSNDICRIFKKHGFNATAWDQSCV